MTTCEEEMHMSEKVFSSAPSVRYAVAYTVQHTVVLCFDFEE